MPSPTLENEDKVINKTGTFFARRLKTLNELLKKLNKHYYYGFQQPNLQLSQGLAIS